MIFFQANCDGYGSFKKLIVVWYACESHAIFSFTPDDNRSSLETLRLDSFSSGCQTFVHKCSYIYLPLRYIEIPKKILFLFGGSWSWNIQDCLFIYQVIQICLRHEEMKPVVNDWEEIFGIWCRENWKTRLHHQLLNVDFDSVECFEDLKIF